MEIRIDYLDNNPQFTDTVAHWIYDEFRPNLIDKTFEDVVNMMSTHFLDKIPIRLVAIAYDKCVGTISLVENELPSRNYTPYLSALFVDPEYRKLGVGQKLVDELMDVVRGLGYKELYLRTEHASGYYRKLGWTFVENCAANLCLKPDVFKCEL